jgi:hypothetical protein
MLMAFRDIAGDKGEKPKSSSGAPNKRCGWSCGGRLRIVRSAVCGYSRELSDM